MNRNRIDFEGCTGTPAMTLTLVSRSAPSSHARRIARAVLVSAVIWSTPVATQASTIGLRFSGTADLSAFGASPGSTFDGSVIWDPGASRNTCGPGGGGEGDFPLSPLDDGPPCVTATIRINSVSYDGFDLELSRLMLFPDWMDLQLWFVPPTEVDGGGGADVQLIELRLRRPHDPGNPVFPDIGRLPLDLSFLSSLRDRSVVFVSPDCFDFEGACVSSASDTLTVVPEPSSALLLLVGSSAAVIRAGRRRSPGGRPKAGG